MIIPLGPSPVDTRPAQAHNCLEMGGRIAKGGSYVVCRVRSGTFRFRTSSILHKVRESSYVSTGL